jgi:hypothetical protein
MQLHQERHDFFAQPQDGAVLTVLGTANALTLVKLAELSRPRPPSLRRMDFLSAIHAGTMGRAAPLASTR